MPWLILYFYEEYTACQAGIHSLYMRSIISDVLQACIHPIYGRILILPHRNDETLLPIDDLRMNL